MIRFRPFSSGQAAAAGPRLTAQMAGHWRPAGRAEAGPYPDAAQAGAGSPLQNTGHVGLVPRPRPVTWVLSSLLSKRENNSSPRGRDNEGKSMDSRSRLLGLSSQEMTLAELLIP